ncbi:unnamed protein product [Symbiodinium natans]|uniref:Uncharacterized protein n=1 Tax=Symbiodinium natans TaxID=878477 RepID=A0A812QWB2_9DINO|nr:unnamed protein product [Symbiodinium natans]
MTDEAEAVGSPTAILDEILAQEEFNLVRASAALRVTAEYWPDDLEEAEGTLSPISQQIADLCGELESCLGSLNSWQHDSHRCQEFAHQIDEEYDAVVFRDYEDASPNWILQDADEEDAGGLDGELVQKRSQGSDVMPPSSRSVGVLEMDATFERLELPTLMRPRAQVSLRKIPETKILCQSVQEEVPTVELEACTGDVDAEPGAGTEASQVEDLEALLAECRRMGAGMGRY